MESWCFVVIIVLLLLYNYSINYRSLFDIYQDLKNDETEKKNNQLLEFENNKKIQNEKNQYLYLKIVFVVSFIVVFTIMYFFNTSIKGVSASLLILFGISVFTFKWLKKHQQQKYYNDIEFYLPLVMERIVMAVEAGLDIISAVQVVVEIEIDLKNTYEQLGKDYQINPVTKLFQNVLKLLNVGFTFEAALNEVSNTVENSSIKHAFIHIALAQKEGGEVIMPLRELSDTTQLQYQENFEELIAKLPIKATLPLISIFTGLIIVFLTGPIIQIITISQSAINR